MNNIGETWVRLHDRSLHVEQKFNPLAIFQKIPIARKLMREAGDRVKNE